MVSIRNKARDTAQSAKGKIKEAAGKTTGSRKLEAKGKADQAKANIKKTGSKIKDKLR